LKDVVELEKPLAALDCVSGELSGHLLKALPAKGRLINYGSLAGKLITNIDSADVRFGGKIL